MKDTIIEKQDNIIKNLKDVGKLYFDIYKKKTTKEDVLMMAKLVAKGEHLESELAALKERESKDQETEEMDLIQYVTNLLYAVRDNNDINDDTFDKWVEERTIELAEYYRENYKKINQKC